MRRRERFMMKPAEAGIRRKAVCGGRRTGDLPATD
jgi:hypothetical protein